MNTVEDEIYAAIKKVKGIDREQLSLNTNLRELEVTSLEFIMISFELEDAYNIEIVDANLDTYQTIREAEEIVTNLIIQKESKRQLESV